MSILDLPSQRAGDLITPTGQLISTAEPSTDEWFAVRRAGITATDVPKILGLSKYGDARAVWHDKRGELPPDEAGEAAIWGHLLEDVVAQRWASIHGVTVQRVGIIANAQLPWMRAALDRLPDTCPLGRGRCGLEIKTRSAYVAGRWRDDVPDDVLAQVAHQRMTTGLDHIHVAALIGGQKLVEHRYDEDPELEAYLLEHTERLWGQVQSGEIPAVEPTQVLADMLDRLFANRSGDAEIDESRALSLVAAYQQAKALEAEAEAAKEAARAAVLDALGPAEFLTSDGQIFFTYKQHTKHSVNVRDLEDNDVELYLQVLEGGHINDKSSRTLRLAYKGEAA